MMPRVVDIPVSIIHTIGGTASAIVAAAMTLAASGSVYYDHGTKFTTLVELKIKYDGTAYNVQIYDAKGTTSRNESATLELTKNDGRRIEGTYVSRNASYRTSADHVFFDLPFALDVARGK
jgi:hypothetical protein